MVKEAAAYRDQLVRAEKDLKGLLAAAEVRVAGHSPPPTPPLPCGSTVQPRAPRQGQDLHYCFLHFIAGRAGGQQGCAGLTAATCPPAGSPAWWRRAAGGERWWRGVQWRGAAAGAVGLGVVVVVSNNSYLFISAVPTDVLPFPQTGAHSGLCYRWPWHHAAGKAAKKQGSKTKFAEPG